MFRWLGPFFQVYLIILIPDSHVPGLGVSLFLPGPAPLPPAESAAPTTASTSLPVSPSVIPPIPVLLIFHIVWFGYHHGWRHHLLWRRHPNRWSISRYLLLQGYLQTSTSSST